MIPIYREKDRAKLFSRLEKRKMLFSGEVLESVRRILSEVRARGSRPPASHRGLRRNKDDPGAHVR